LGGREFTSRKPVRRSSYHLILSSNVLSKYVPAAQEPVIGIVTARQGEGWRVDIGSAHQASLDGLAFEGASRRNRPNLKVRRVSGLSPPIVKVN